MTDVTGTGYRMCLRNTKIFMLRAELESEHRGRTSLREMKSVGLRGNNGRENVWLRIFSRLNECLFSVVETH